ncbi:MAG TPA: carboxy terminal-processing peptidase [Ferruginibacter sp.]|nr:carboxy terminal-processing peptidase [Ferruginibacter sp.]
MSRKILPVLAILIGAALFIALQTQGRGTDDNPKSKNERILHEVGLLLVQAHYSPRKLDDSFSKLVLKNFITELDADKFIFLQTDIDSFKKFENAIDDEIRGNIPLSSVYYIGDLYSKRLAETSSLYAGMLSKPFDFNKDDSIVIDPDKLDFAKTQDDKNVLWYKRLKYMALTKYVDLLDEREKNKDKKDFVYKADSTLEREARASVQKQIGRYFTTLKNHNTPNEIFGSFVEVITNTMDPHTDYFPPVDARSFNEQMSGAFFGIGAQLKEDDSKIKIASLIVGGPAWKSGELKVDDEIIKIAEGKGEPVDVTGYAVSDAVKLIRGSEKGTEVRLTIKRPDGTIKVVPILRDQIKLDDTFAKSVIINGKHKIGYIELPEFYLDYEKADGAKCSEDVAKEVEKLEAEKVEGIIIDLRDNGGGSLPEVVKMAGLFIEDGPVCQVKGRGEKAYQLDDRDKSVLYSGPLTVMVNENSASASEIFAAAIQDYKRGLIIGSTSTYGKGTVQRNVPLNPDADNGPLANDSDDLGTVKLTFEKFYRISGASTQLKGVASDIVIPDRLEYDKSREKDNPSALSWDEIARADYKTWQNNYSPDAVASSANKDIKNNATFKALKATLDSIAMQDDKVYSLNLAKYMADAKKLKATYKELEDLYKLPKDLNVTNDAADIDAINANVEKQDKNKKFINSVKSDIYIDETVKVMDNMINQINVVKSN